MVHCCAGEGGLSLPPRRSLSAVSGRGRGGGQSLNQGGPGLFRGRGGGPGVAGGGAGRRSGLGLGAGCWDGGNGRGDGGGGAAWLLAGGGTPMYVQRGWVEGSSINSRGSPLLGSTPRNLASAPNPFSFQLNLDPEPRPIFENKQSTVLITPCHPSATMPSPLVRKGWMPMPTMVRGKRTAFKHDETLNNKWRSAQKAFSEYMSNPQLTKLYSSQKGLFRLLVLIRLVMRAAERPRCSCSRRSIGRTPIRGPWHGTRSCFRTSGDFAGAR